MNKPRPNEIPKKQWLTEEAVRIGVSTHTLIMRLARGKHPQPKMRRVNSRVIFVIQEKV